MATMHWINLIARRPIIRYGRFMVSVRKWGPSVCSDRSLVHGSRRSVLLWCVCTAVVCLYCCGVSVLLWGRWTFFRRMTCTWEDRIFGLSSFGISFLNLCQRFSLPVATDLDLLPFWSGTLVSFCLYVSTTTTPAETASCWFHWNL